MVRAILGWKMGTAVMFRYRTIAVEPGKSIPGCTDRFRNFACGRWLRNLRDTRDRRHAGSPRAVSEQAGTRDKQDDHDLLFGCKVEKADLGPLNRPNRLPRSNDKTCALSDAGIREAMPAARTAAVTAEGDSPSTETVPTAPSRPIAALAIVCPLAMSIITEMAPL